MHRIFIGLGLLILSCDPNASPAPSEGESTPPRAKPSPNLFELLDETPSVLEYHEVDELGPAQHGLTLRVHGWVKPGSVMQRRSPPSIRFELVRGDAATTVEYAGPLPDRFQDRLETIVTGTLSDDGTTLVSDTLVTKCPSDYDALPPWPQTGAPR
ncbi:MAG: cytochrome c maturation protein CcmE [Deltaproteobacteria bacterium]|nr:cytochrome c maturation protein CcmE [Deltaproteobacteria bacterium]